ncbi:MAG: DUF3299 domain-containing protein [Alphaproteobacteria bacterium]
MAMAAIACLILAGGAVAGPKPLELTWKQLIPEGSGGPDYTRVSPVLQIIRGLTFGETGTAPVVASLDGRDVRLSGYVVPLKHEGMRVREFLLVPYVGACIHVPPPPRNQIVHVTAKDPIRVKGLFAAVTVTGIMSTRSSDTGLAETGYRIASGDIRPYDEYRRVRELQGHAPND